MDHQRFRGPGFARHLRNYGGAAAAVLVAFAIAKALELALGPTALPPFITFYPTVLVVGLAFGWGPALLATAAGGAMAAVWIYPASIGGTASTTEDRLRLVQFLAMGVFMSVVAGLYARARRNALSYERELTLRKRTEAAQQEALGRFSAVLSILYGSVLLVSNEGRVELANRAFCSQFGLPGAPEDLTGLTSEQVIERIRHAYRDPERETRRIAEILEHGEPVRGEEVMMADGRTLLRDFTPISIAGQPFGRLWHQFDITEQRRTQEALRLSEEKFSQAFASNPAAIVLSRLSDGKLLEVNDTWVELTGHRREDVVGGSARTLGVWPTVEEAQRFVRALEEKGFLRGWEQRFFRKSGEAFVAQLSAQILIMNQEKVILSTLVDITERKRFEERMLQTQKLESLGVLAGGIAHDFNNILQAILGSAELAASQLPPGSAALPNLQVICRSAKRAGDLTRQMLAYSGKGRFQVEPLHLSDVIREMREMLGMSVSKKAVLRYTLAQELPSIRADLSQIRQVLMNLVINASESLGNQTGTIDIMTGSMDCDGASLGAVWSGEPLKAGTYVVLEVTDTGCGMDEATRLRIFDPFFTTKFTGRGLGLAAVMGIVRGHGGAIRVHSEPGKGTSFRLLFPSFVGAPTSLVRPDRSCQEWQGQGTLLLVDDEAGIRAVGRQMLGYLGFCVLTAADGRQALETLQAHRADITCVILDLTMPSMDGEETFREMRRLAPDLKVILSSGYNEQTVIQRWVGDGLAGFIQKPYELSTLERTLRSILG
ncbi:MAG TPA: PAS domain S-box protein [Spirochaetia bacterium]|nr:PAS domain S-box protein [Spirochaetia bacterium]